MLGYGDFVIAAGCTLTTHELGALLIKDMADEGYQNLSFVSTRNRNFVGLTWVSMPEGFADAYIAYDFKKHDPILSYAERTHGHFSWSSVEKIGDLSPQQFQVLKARHDFGLRSGGTFVAHGEDGTLNLIGYSQNSQTKLDPARSKLVREKIAFAYYHYQELKRFSKSVQSSLACLQGQHPHSPPGMTLARCRALVLVDIAATRWKLGSTDLNLNLNDFVRQDDLDYLMRWGFIHEIPEETHFRYILTPTVLGKNHIRVCAHAPELHRSLWEIELTTGQLPTIYE